MRMLYGQLESDPLCTAEEFRKVFVCLRDHCGMPWENVQNILDKPPWLFESWSRGENIPNRKRWSEISLMVMRIIKKELKR